MVLLPATKASNARGEASGAERSLAFKKKKKKKTALEWENFENANNTRL